MLVVILHTFQPLISSPLSCQAQYPASMLTLKATLYISFFIHFVLQRHVPELYPNDEWKDRKMNRQWTGGLQV